MRNSFHFPWSRGTRHFIGRSGQVDVYVYDLYTIALSKIARGFETDMDDVIFLLKSNLIDLAELQRYFQAVLPRAAQADIIPSEFQRYFQDLQRRLAAE